MMPEFDILRPAGWPRGSCLRGAGGRKMELQFGNVNQEAHVL